MGDLDLKTRMNIATGDEGDGGDCTCHAAGGSQAWQEHDPLCAYRVICEAEETIATLTADLRKATIQISHLAQAKGEAEGRLLASEMAGVVEGWREQNERLAADLREARERAAKLASALVAVRDRIIEPIHGGIDDTFWMTPGETVADFIEVALTPGEQFPLALTDPHQAAGSASNGAETDG